MGIGYFWFFGGTVMLMTIQMAKEISGGGDDFSSVGAVLMAWMSGGTVLGGILASVICRRHIRMNVSVAGGVLMAASCAALAAVSMTSPVFNALLMAAGISAALFLVPLNAFFQDRADNDKRGDMIAAGNLVDCALGLLAVGFQYAMMLVIPLLAIRRHGNSQPLHGVGGLPFFPRGFRLKVVLGRQPGAHP